MIARIHATRCLLHVTRSQFPSRFVRANSSRGTKISSVCSKYKGIKGIFTKFTLAFIIRQWNKAQSVIKLRVSHARFSWTLTFSSPFSFNHHTFDVFLSLASFFQEQPPVTPWRQTYVSKCNPSLSIFPRQPL